MLEIERALDLGEGDQTLALLREEYLRDEITAEEYDQFVSRRYNELLFSDEWPAAQRCVRDLRVVDTEERMIEADIARHTPEDVGAQQLIDETELYGRIRAEFDRRQIPKNGSAKPNLR